MYSRPILFIGVDRLAHRPRMLSPNEGKPCFFFKIRNTTMTIFWVFVPLPFVIGLNSYYLEVLLFKNYT